MTRKSEKQERMQLRRDIGNRVVETRTISPYTSKHRYLIAHACFVCRKSFKLEPRDKNQTPAKCPDCGGKLTLMGRNFKPPKKNDVKQWQKVKYLVENGVLFHRYNDDRYGPYPKTLEEDKEFVKHVHKVRENT